jgi:hypothetical protein
MARYSTYQSVRGGESGWCLRKKRNGKRVKRKNGKKKNGKYRC